MKAREAILESELFSPQEISMLLPICQEGSSDSSNFDMALELLVLSGRTLPHTLMMLIPEAWQENKEMDPKRRAFYQYHANVMEPWDVRHQCALPMGYKWGQPWIEMVFVRHVIQ